MKKITMIMLLCIATLFTYGQQALELKVKQSSDLPNTAPEHFYLIQVTNTSNVSKEFTIVTNDTNCDDIELSKQVLLVKQVLNAQKSSGFESSSIQAHSTLDFYIKISRKPDTPVGKWNCIEIKAVSENDYTISNTLTIKSQIPDPKNFN